MKNSCVRHGTRCAGVIAAAARENSTCGGPGIAFNARVGGQWLNGSGIILQT